MLKVKLKDNMNNQGLDIAHSLSSQDRNFKSKINMVYANTLNDEMPENEFNPPKKNNLFKVSIMNIKTGYSKVENDKLKINYDNNDKSFTLSFNGVSERLNINNLIDCYISLKDIDKEYNQNYLFIKQIMFYGDLINENNELFNKKNIDNFCSILNIEDLREIIFQYDEYKFNLVNKFIRDLISIIIETLKEYNNINTLIKILKFHIEFNNLTIEYILNNN